MTELGHLGRRTDVTGATFTSRDLRMSEWLPARRSSRRVLALELGVEVVVSLVLAAAVATFLDMLPVVACLVVGLSLAFNHLDGRQGLYPGLPRPEHVLRNSLVPFGAIGFGVVVGWWDRSDLTEALVLALACAAVTLVAAALRTRRPVRHRVVLVGASGEVADAENRWAGNRQVAVVGSLVVEPLLDDPGVPLAQRGEREAALVEVLPEALREMDPDMVVLHPGPGLDEDLVRRVGWALEEDGIALMVDAGFSAIAPHRVRALRFADSHLLQVRSSRPPARVRLLKAVADRVLAGIGLVLVAPLLLVLAVAVRATSHGPAFFTQTRIGRDGRPFTLYKLRTMGVDAEARRAAILIGDEGNGLLFKQQRDPRVTRIGAVLRKYSLDELPQLLNVLQGQMSLIGPRPALPEEVARYTPLERRRLAVRPGMTGAWQVGGRSTLSREASMRLDVDYVDNYRLLDDALLLVRTVDAVARPRGAW